MRNMMLLRLFLVAGVTHWLPHVGAVKESLSGETPYLKEILLGRCYQNPPLKQGTPDECPDLVGQLVAVWEGKRDEEITPKDFDFYFEKADFTISPNQSPLFWMGSDPMPGSFSTLVRPQDTAGGALLEGLVFCGSDLRSQQACPVFFSKDRRRLDAEQEQQAQQAAQQQQQQAQQEQEQQAQVAAIQQQQQAQQEEQEEPVPVPPKPDDQDEEEELVPVPPKQPDDQEEPDPLEPHDEEEPVVDSQVTGAFASFWTRVYEAFAEENNGAKIIVAVPGDASSASGLFLSASLPHLNASTLDLFLVTTPKDASLSCDTAPVVAELQSALQQQGLEDPIVTCTEDPEWLKLRLCVDGSPDSEACHLIQDAPAAPTPPEASSVEPSDKDDNKTYAWGPDKNPPKNHAPHVVLVLTLVLLGSGIAYFVKQFGLIQDGYELIPQTIKAPSQ